MTATLKITAIIPYPVWVGIRNQMLVKVETDQGVFGWGESGLSGRERAVTGAIEHFREFLIGQNPLQGLPFFDPLAKRSEGVGLLDVLLAIQAIRQGSGTRATRREGRRATTLSC